MGSVVAGNRLLLPRLRQLPEQAVAMEYMRQTLLGQYAQVRRGSKQLLNLCMVVRPERERCSCTLACVLGGWGVVPVIVSVCVQL